MDRQHEIERLIVDLKEQGMSYREIGEELEKRGILTIRGKKKEWHPGAIHRIYKRVSSVNQSEQTDRQPPKKRDRQPANQFDKQKDKQKVRQVDNQIDNQKERSADITSKILELQKEVKELHTELAAVRQELNTLKNESATQRKDKQKKAVSIDGWNVQNADGYYRLYRRIKGKMECIYLGKFLDKQKARQKIAEKELKLEQGTTQNV